MQVHTGVVEIPKENLLLLGNSAAEWVTVNH